MHEKAQGGKKKKQQKKMPKTRGKQVFFFSISLPSPLLPFPSLPFPPRGCLKILLLTEKGKNRFMIKLT